MGQIYPFIAWEVLKKGYEFKKTNFMSININVHTMKFTSMGCYKTLDIVVLVHICISLFLTTLTLYFYFKLLHFKKIKILSKSMFLFIFIKKLFYTS